MGRYGGEEFIIILPAANVDDAVAFAERVRRAVEEREFTYDGGSLHRTLSAGVAAWPHPDLRHQEALVKAADDALYVAKERGRNRVVAYGGPEFAASAAADAATDAATDAETDGAPADGAATDRLATDDVATDGAAR